MSLDYLPELNYGAAAAAAAGEEEEEEEDDERKEKCKIQPSTSSGRGAENRERVVVVRQALGKRSEDLFKAVLFLAETRELETEDDLVEWTQKKALFTCEEFVHLCDERALGGICGLPTCGRPNLSAQDVSRSRSGSGSGSGSAAAGGAAAPGPGRYELSLKERRVYNTEVTRKFCSRVCAHKALDYSKKLGTTVKVDDDGLCFISRPSAGKNNEAVEAGKNASTSGNPKALLEVPTHGSKTKAGRGYRIDTVASRGVVERQVKEKTLSQGGGGRGRDKKVRFQMEGEIQEKSKKSLPSSRHPFNNRVVESKGKKKTLARKEAKSRREESNTKQKEGGGQSPGIATAQQGESGSGAHESQQGGTEQEQPVIYFEIENQKRKNGKGGVQVGRLKVVGGEDSLDEGDGVTPMDAEDSAQGADRDPNSSSDQPEVRRSRKDLPYNLASLLPSSYAEKQERLRKAIMESNIREGKGRLDEEGYDEYASDTMEEEDMEDMNLGTFELSLSSFGKIWNFFNTTITQKLLTFLDGSYTLGTMGILREPKGCPEQTERGKIFCEQISRVLPYLYQENGISSRLRCFKALEVELNQALKCFSFDSPVTSMSFDEWCLVGLVLLRALAENVVVDLKAHLSSESKKMNEFLVKSGLTKSEFNMILDLLLLEKK